jgi:hypothetical protein
MNVSLNEIAYDVIELYRANYKDTDSLSRFQVYHWINMARAFLIKQRLAKNIYAIYPEELQIMSDLAVTQVGATTRIVTTSNIPSTINRRGYHGTLTRVTLPYLTTADPAFSDGPVQVVERNRFNRTGNRKFNSGFYYATIGADKKLYMKPVTLAGSSYIEIEGVFQNPVEVMTANSVSDPYDADYPINMELLSDIKKLIINENFRSILQQMEDKTSDGRDSTIVEDQK